MTKWYEISGTWFAYITNLCILTFHLHMCLLYLYIFVKPACDLFSACQVYVVKISNIESVKNCSE